MVTPTFRALIRSYTEKSDPNGKEVKHLGFSVEGLGLGWKGFRDCLPRAINP